MRPALYCSNLPLLVAQQAPDPVGQGLVGVARTRPHEEARKVAGVARRAREAHLARLAAVSALLVLVRAGIASITITHGYLIRVGS